VTSVDRLKAGVAAISNIIVAGETLICILIDMRRA
jgi:hypothetical protein